MEILLPLWMFLPLSDYVMALFLFCYFKLYEKYEIVRWMYFVCFFKSFKRWDYLNVLVFSNF